MTDSIYRHKWTQARFIQSKTDASYLLKNTAAFILALFSTLLSKC